MILFILRRLLFGVSLIFVVASLAFFLVFADGASVARSILGESATADEVAAKAHELGLDRPIFVQYADWLGSAVRGDLGVSYFTTETVAQAVSSRVGVTLSIVLGAVLVTAIVSIGLGMLAAVRRGNVDRAVQVLSVAGISLPNYWVALMLVLWLAVGLKIFPATGYVPPDVSVGAWLATIALPVTALAIGGVAAATQQVRGAVIDVLQADYIRTARSRGTKEGAILFRHALKNAAPPGLTILSLQFIGLLSGAIVIEKVFALPGLGTLAVNATLQGDTPIVLGVVVITVVLVVVVNLLIDLANGWVNPKVRLS